MGSLTGRVVDEQGKPVADADLSFDYTGEQDLHFTGSQTRTAIRPCRTHGRRPMVHHGQEGQPERHRPQHLGSARRILEVADIVIKASADAAAPAPTGDAGGKAAEMQKLMTAVSADMTAGNYDAALDKLNQAVTKDEKCASCYVHIGDVNIKKNDNDNAEKSLQQGDRARREQRRRL